MLLQANDYDHLHEHEGCELQIGGSDQWGNILSGVDLIRRRRGAAVHALCWPLLTAADGTKIGKTTGARVWLDPDAHLAVRVLPALDQHRRRRGARGCWPSSRCCPMAEIDALVAEHARRPAPAGGPAGAGPGGHRPRPRRRRPAQAAEEATEILFGADPRQASPGRPGRRGPGGAGGRARPPGEALAAGVPLGPGARSGPAWPPRRAMPAGSSSRAACR